MNIVQKLRSMVGEIGKAQGKKLDEAWALVERILGRVPVDQEEGARVVKERDVAGLDILVAKLENPQAEAPKPKAGDQVSEGDMDAALKAFKKRLKLARLSDESRLGNRYTTGGRKSEIDAIIAPTEWPKEVWDALVEAGRLQYTGQGFYALV